MVLIHIPYPYHPDWQRETNSFYGYAEKNGSCFVNYMNEDLALDLDIAFYDQGHLNPAGMQRMTKKLGELLREMGWRTSGRVPAPRIEKRNMTSLLTAAQKI